jgi:WD40 repeat protein
LYHTYFESENEGHQSLLIYNDKDNIIKLIESSFGIIRIWDFHSAKLLNKLKINDYDLRGICLWNNDYLLVGSYDKSIKVINLKKMIIVRNLQSHDNYVITIKKIFHPLYGECLISQGWKTDQIRMWSSNNL